jgi:hypothetical protein
MAVTKDDVVRATRRWLDPDQRAVLFYRRKEA